MIISPNKALETRRTKGDCLLLHYRRSTSQMVYGHGEELHHPSAAVIAVGRSKVVESHPAQIHLDAIAAAVLGARDELRVLEVALYEAPQVRQQVNIVGGLVLEHCMRILPVISAA